MKKKTYFTILKALGIYLVLFLFSILMLRIYTHHGKSQPVPDFKGLSKERVIELADYNDLRIQVIDSNYIEYLPKGSVIDQNPAPGIKVKKNRTIFLTLNAFTQVKVEVPNVIGLSFRQGKTTIENRGLKVGKIIYVPDFARNNILKQMYYGEPIKKGTKLEKGQSIDLVLGNGYRNGTYPIPDLHGQTSSSAKSKIKDNYFNVGDVIYDKSVKTYKDSMNARVWKQSPKYYKNSKAYTGRDIDIWLTIDNSYFATDSTQNDTIL